MLTPLAAAAPALIPAVFGPRWAPAAWAVPTACLGLLLAAPFSVAASGYLYAEGDANAVLKAMFYSAVGWYAVMLPLLPIVGVAAIGLGQLAAGIIEVVLFDRFLRRYLGHLRPTAAVALPIAVMTVSGGAGWAVAFWGPHSLLTALDSAALAAALALLGSWITRRRELVDLVSVTRRSVGAAIA